MGRAQLKVGSFSRSERMAKWNEALRIEESLGTKALRRASFSSSVGPAQRRECCP